MRLLNILLFYKSYIYILYILSLTDYKTNWQYDRKIKNSNNKYSE